jgi:hypothetical protein
MEYKEKYINKLYSLQYIIQNGGAINIVNYLKKAKISDIQKHLIEYLSNNKYCVKILGEGAFGKVYVPSINQYQKIETNKKIIELPIVIKEIKKKDIQNDKEIFDLIVVNKKLYIYGNMSIMPEVLILLFNNELWHKKKSPHLPFLIGYSSCDSDKINMLMTEKHGLKTNIVQKLDTFDEGNLWHSKSNKSKIFDSNLNTLKDLFYYVMINMKNNYVVLPNKIKCNIIELFDYICISYLHTHNLYQKNNIYISDMHMKNIFIHWLSDESYLGDTNIGNIEYINYKIGKKIYGIKTFGFLIKTGDLGTSIIKVRKDVIIVGQGINIEKNYKIIDYLMNTNYNVFWFIRRLSRVLPLSISNQLVLNEIMNSHPYDKLESSIGTVTYDFLNKFKSPTDLLAYYHKYEIKNNNKKNTLVVDDH